MYLPTSAFVVGTPLGIRCGDVATGHHSLCGRTTTTAAASPLPESIQGKLMSLVQRLIPREEKATAKRGSSDGKTAVIFGGTGTTGAQLAKLLTAAGNYQVVVTGRSREKFDGLFEGSDAEFQQVDVRESEAVQRLSSRADVIFWVAGPQQGSSSLEVDQRAVEGMVAGLSKNVEHKFLFDFADPSTAANFSSLDDVIMGGMSSSSMVQGEGYASFAGNVTLARNGGFCQMRQVFPGPQDWSRGEGLLLKFRGDGRRYKVNLKNTTEPEFVWQADFDTAATGEWEVARIPFARFVPVKRGRVVYGNGVYALYDQNLNLSEIRSISLVQSKVGIGIPKCPAFVPGDFCLDVESIELFSSSTPKIVLMSSAGVTRLDWSEEKKKVYPKAASIPIVALNPGNILRHKFEGEQAVRGSGIPYCIVRATGLNDEHPRGTFDCSQGDTLSGRINRADMSQFLADVSESPSASFKTIEVRTNPGSPQGKLSDSFFERFEFDTAV